MTVDNADAFQAVLDQNVKDVVQPTMSVRDDAVVLEGDVDFIDGVGDNQFFDTIDMTDNNTPEKVIVQGDCGLSSGTYRHLPEKLVVQGSLVANGASLHALPDHLEVRGDMAIRDSLVDTPWPDTLSVRGMVDLYDTAIARAFCATAVGSAVHCGETKRTDESTAVVAPTSDVGYGLSVPDTVQLLTDDILDQIEVLQVNGEDYETIPLSGYDGVRIFSYNNQATVDTADNPVFESVRSTLCSLPDWFDVSPPETSLHYAFTTRKQSGLAAECLYQAPRLSSPLFTPRRGVEDDDMPDFDGRSDVIRKVRDEVDADTTAVDAWHHEKGLFSVEVTVPFETLSAGSQSDEPNTESSMEM